MQCYAEKQALGEVSQDLLDTQVNPAVWEISGHIVLKRRTDFEEASEISAWRLLAEVSLSEERFEEVKDCIFQATGLAESDEEEETTEESPCASSSSVPLASSHIPEGCLVRQ
jgi:GDP-L-galactose phosphorylase